MSAPLPNKERTLRFAITVALILFIVEMAVALKTAHCADVVKPAAIYLSLSAADLASTALATQNGAIEGNAFMRSHRIEKQLVVAGALTAADAYLQKKGGRGVRALRISVAVIRVGAVVVNVRNARRQR